MPADLLCPQAEKSAFVETKHGYGTVFNRRLRGFMYAGKPRTPIFSEYQFLGGVGQVIFVVILNKCGFWGNWCGGIVWKEKERIFLTADYTDDADFLGKKKV